MRITLYMLSTVMVVNAAFANDYSERELSDEEWRADINEYVELVEETHIDMYHSVSEEDFQRAVSTLLESVPKMGDKEIAMELRALAAMIGDGHTWIAFGDSIGSGNLPFSVYEFEDGVFVTLAMPGYEKHIGKQLVSVGGVSVEDLLLRVDRYISRDNEWGLLSSRAGWLMNENFLVHESIVKPGDGALITLLEIGGSKEQIKTNFVSDNEFIEAIEKLPDTPDGDLPMYRQRGSEFYWSEYLPKKKVLFVKFNVVRDADAGPRLGQFADELLDFVDSNKVRKLIVDVRHNGGGNGNLTRRLVRQIATNKRINQPGRLFVITGRRTFSAALMFTARMERRTEALFVGEPGAGKPNSYSEFNGFTLSNSKMHGSISSIWHEEGEPDDVREYIPVDISVALSSEDYFARKDPVLDAILAY